MSNENQTDRVLAYLKRRGKINPLQALEKLGVFRLAARIADLRRIGYAIERRMVTVRNRFGEPCRVAEYRVGKENTV